MHLPHGDLYNSLVRLQFPKILGILFSMPVFLENCNHTNQLHISLTLKRTIRDKQKKTRIAGFFCDKKKMVKT